MTYDDKHWEELISTIISRIGEERFFDHLCYVLREERNRPSLASIIEGLVEKPKNIHNRFSDTRIP